MRFLFFCLFAATLSGADLTGIWNGQITDRNGDVQDVSFRFLQKGDTLTGKLYGDNESTPISEGQINGNQITFAVSTELNGQISKFVYSGTIVAPAEGVATITGPPNNQEQIQLTRQRVGGNFPGSKKGQNQKQSITLKRVA